MHGPLGDEAPTAHHGGPHLAAIPVARDLVTVVRRAEPHAPQAGVGRVRGEVGDDLAAGAVETHPAMAPVAGEVFGPPAEGGGEPAYEEEGAALAARGVEDLCGGDLLEVAEAFGGGERVGEEGTPGREADPLQVADSRHVLAVDQGRHLAQRVLPVLAGGGVNDHAVGEVGQGGELRGVGREGTRVPQKDRQVRYKEGARQALEVVGGGAFRVDRYLLGADLGPAAPHVAERGELGVHVPLAVWVGDQYDRPRRVAARQVGDRARNVGG